MPGDHSCRRARPCNGQAGPDYVKEYAPWSAVRNAANAYGFAAFTVDPGTGPDSFTTIKVEYYDVLGTDVSSRCSIRSRCAARVATDGNWWL